MDPVNNSPGIAVGNANDVQEMDARAEEVKREIEESIVKEKIQSSLASHVLSVFQENKDARSTSGMEEKMLQSLRAYNGHYDPEDVKRISEEGGSDIYMNLTPTKCRAAMSWIRDILLPAKEEAWSLEPTPVPDVPQETKDLIRERIDEFMSQLEADPTQQGQQGPGAAAVKMKSTNQLQRDLEEAFFDEVYELASKEVKKFERVVADQLVEGDWENALSNFIEDFCVFPVAVMKGPVVIKKKRIAWAKGRPVEKEVKTFLNKRVSPLDIYPSPSAAGINDGNLCEHLRMHRNELASLRGAKHYNTDDINEILKDDGNRSDYQYLSTYIEDEKSIEEFRGDTYKANKDVYHGVHYHGSASYKMLKEWGYPESELGNDETAEFEVEIVLVGDKVIKARINKDPLLRRPYYKASFQNIPGSWWGRSLPELMRDIQRMCNATARALANNMGIASGPQGEVYIDRLAADEEIDDIYPFKLWQVTSDPTGGGGRAVQFWQPTSNAQELLTVYKEFEIRADDATGIPRYAYGNERTGGAAQTASGLSMLLESASKGIKDAIRHIDDGLIKPRVEYQFYLNMLSQEERIDFTGDVVVVPKGSQALTMRGAQEMRRNEFLQILGNQQYLQIVGVEGVAEILRVMAKSLGLGENIVPSRIELKIRQKQAEEAQRQQQEQEAQLQQQDQAVGVQQVQMQTQQAEMASQRNAQLKQREIEGKEAIEAAKLQQKAVELQVRREEGVSKNTTALTKQQMADAQKDRDTNKNIALSIRSGYRDKNNAQ